jgi:hypothetical protein
MCTLRAVPKAHQQQSKEATYWASGPTYTTACLPDGRTRTQQVAKFPVSSSSHSGAGATQNRDWRWAPPPSPPRSMITAINSSHNRLDSRRRHATVKFPHVYDRGVGGGEKGYQYGGREGARCGVTIWLPVGAEIGKKLTASALRPDFPRFWPEGCDKSCL